MFRLATYNDMSELLRMGELFFNASGYSDITTFNKDDAERLLGQLIDSETILTDGKHSMLGYLVFPIFMNVSCLVAQELFWWVDEDHRKGGAGVQLLKQVERQAKKQGATTMMMLSLKELDGDKVNKLYLRLGYSEREKTFMRAL